MAHFLDELWEAVLRGLWAPLLRLAGLLWLRVRSPHRARASFARVLEISPDHFGACMGLGRALLAIEEFEGAALAFRRARRIDPIRFESTREAAMLLHERDASNDSAEAEQEGSFDNEPGYYLPLPSTFVSPGHPTRPGSASRKHAKSNTKAFRFKDFASYEEYRRFQDAPPIKRDEIARIDWDRLIEQFFRR